MSYLKKVFTLCSLLAISLAIGACQGSEPKEEASWTCPQGKSFQMNGESFVYPGPLNDPQFDYETRNLQKAIQEGKLELVGTIQSQTEEIPSLDFQAYGIPVGTDIYQHPDTPYLAYLDTGERYLARYYTGNAGQWFLFHEGELYLSEGYLSSEIREQVAAAFRDVSDYGKPDDAVSIGDTHFVGYNTYPTDELGSNYHSEPLPVFRSDRMEFPVLFLRYPRNIAIEEDQYTYYVPYGLSKEME